VSRNIPKALAENQTPDIESLRP